MNSNFKRWYYSNRGFILQCERAESELIGCTNPKVIDAWLEAAFVAGMCAAQEPQRYNHDAIHGEHGWQDVEESK